MASKTSPSVEIESDDWHESEELRQAVKNFDRIYAMPKEKLERVKTFHEEVLDNFFNYLGFCIDIKKIGGSYEGVKVVKSEKDDDFEFDVMFVLKIPEQCHLEIVEILERPGYALLNVPNWHKNTPDYYRTASHKFFEGCLTLENDTYIVDAGKTSQAFFGHLQKWMNTKPVPGYKLLPRQHGTAIQMDVILEQTGRNTFKKNDIFYSVDIAPTLEIMKENDVKRYVVKPEKKRMPDSITWRRLFDSGENDSGQEHNARKVLRSAVEELHKQLSEFCVICKRPSHVCQGSCAMVEARVRRPLQDEYILKLQEALVRLKSSYRLTVVNLQDLNKSTNKRLVAINYSFEKELEVLAVPEKPGYAWLKLRKDPSASSHFNDALKLCYLPGGKYLDNKAASDMLVKELQDIVNGLFEDEDTIVRRDGPVVRVDVYPEKGNTMRYYYLDIVLAACVEDNFYVGLPHDYDDIPEKKAWRISFSFEETTAIQQAPEGLRKVFRVLKALRNGEPGLAQLTSYHMKNLLLKTSKSETMDWNESLVGKILVRVFKELKICLEEKKLETYYIPEINLLKNMTNDCSFHMQKRIEELLRRKRKMFKALKNPEEETTDDVLKKYKNESVQVFVESHSVQSYSYGSFRSHLMAEINEQLLGYDYVRLVSKPVYQDITVFKVSEGEVPYNYNAMMTIHNNKNNLRARQYNRSVIRLEHCNSTTSSSLHQTVTHISGLADTKQTAEYIKRQMQELIHQSTMLLDNVCLRLGEEYNIVLESKAAHSDLRLTILPGYEVGERVFVAMPRVTDTNAWVPIPFTPVRNKFWKAFQINECGMRVLNELRGIQNRERVMARLGEGHLRMAIFWEMEVQRDWTESKMTERIHDVLDRLLTSIKHKNLPDYFFPSRNTLEQF